MHLDFRNGFDLIRNWKMLFGKIGLCEANGFDDVVEGLPRRLSGTRTAW